MRETKWLARREAVDDPKCRIPKAKINLSNFISFLSSIALNSFTALSFIVLTFDFDPEVQGDIEVKARGTESLMRNEVRSQRLLQLMQIGSNPALAPFVKFPVILREIAHSFDLDAEKFVNDEREALRQAKVMQASGMMQAPPQSCPRAQRS